MSRAFAWTGSLGIAAAFLALAFALLRPEPESARFALQAPATAARGAVLEGRLRLLAPLPAGVLRIDLHGTDASGRTIGFLAAAPPVAGTGLRHADFRIEVPADPRLASVFLVVYATPDGTWSSRTLTARSEPLPVADPGEGPAERVAPAMRDEAPDARAGDNPPSAPPAPSLRRLAALVWAGAALLALARRAPGTGPLLALGCVAAGLWEALAPDAALAGIARDYALAHALYEERRLPQQALTLAAAAALAAALACSLHRRPRHLPAAARAGFALCAALGVAGTLSLHATDAMLSLPLLGLPLEALLRCAAALLGLAGAAQRGRQGSPIT